MQDKTYASLGTFPLERGASYFRPQQELPERVSPDHPARDCMTDLRQLTALTVDLNTPIDGALQKMIEGGVRLLLVTDPSQVILGLITTTDIQGEKPVKSLQALGGRRSDLLVRDIMTPHDQLDVLRMDDVLAARVGDIVATLKEHGRQHALVEDVDQSTNKRAVRGIFSTSQISRQLGIQIESAGKARTFAELEAAIIAS